MYCACGWGGRLPLASQVVVVTGWCAAGLVVKKRGREEKTAFCYFNNLKFECTVNDRGGLDFMYIISKMTLKHGFSNLYEEFLITLACEVKVALSNMLVKKRKKKTLKPGKFYPANPGVAGPWGAQVRVSGLNCTEWQCVWEHGTVPLRRRGAAQGKAWRVVAGRMGRDVTILWGCGKRTQPAPPRPAPPRLVAGYSWANP